ncbi:hypothetical protein P2T68_17275 [Pseudomonas sp. G11]|uniref:hypothetical protein n=1 Tax=Pseudomonas sp. G11 TaxID=528343 RepID=UPI0024026812|nr:hypothetical protein [Pseudomonas sp. G11]WEX18992.1 hypothetical protein P2T68_17275 [Pseudomonas sp. G11]
MSDLTSGLYGALLGGVVAAIATYVVARIQLKQIANQHTETIKMVTSNHFQSLDLVTKHHQEAMVEQNRLLKATFEHQLLLQANEQKLQYKLDFLKDISRLIDGEAAVLVQEGSNLRNDSKGQIRQSGAYTFSLTLEDFRDRVSLVVGSFGSVLNQYSHLDSLRSAFDSTLVFQRLFFEPIQVLVESLKKLPSSPEEEVLDLLSTKLNGLSSAVESYMNWHSNCRVMCREHRKLILDGADSKA